MFEEEISMVNTSDRLASRVNGMVYTYYLDQDIGMPEEYRDLISTLENMNETDTMVLMINSYGGVLHTAVAIVNAIRSTRGNVHGVNCGVAISAASCIFLACHSAEVTDHSSLMAHTGSGVEMGKLSDTSKSIIHAEGQINKFYRDVYEHFFTEDEISRMLKGEDFWLNDDEICERLQKRQELLEKEEEESTEYITYDDLMKMTKKDILKTLGVGVPAGR